MRSLEFVHGLRQYRLTDILAFHDGFSGQPELAETEATTVLRAVLASPLSGLGAQILSSFPWIDGDRAGVPLFEAASLADRIGALIGRGHMLLLMHDELVIGASPGLMAAAATAITADRIRVIMPHARTRADDYVEALETAMTTHGIDMPERRAAFLAQIAIESGELRATEENLRYSAERMMRVWPRRFPTLASATPYARNPEALGNRVYADRMGNGNEASGDGYRYRGRGLMQVTGRANYRRLGFETAPAALAVPATAADTAAAFWEKAGLNTNAETALNRAKFDVISRIINGGDHGSQERWDAYQRALTALRPAPAAAPGRLP